MVGGIFLTRLVKCWNNSIGDGKPVTGVDGKVYCIIVILSLKTTIKPSQSLRRFWARLNDNFVDNYYNAIKYINWRVVKNRTVFSVTRCVYEYMQ